MFFLRFCTTQFFFCEIPSLDRLNDTNQNNRWFANISRTGHYVKGGYDILHSLWQLSSIGLYQEEECTNVEHTTRHLAMYVYSVGRGMGVSFLSLQQGLTYTRIHTGRGRKYRTASSYQLPISQSQQSIRMRFLLPRKTTITAGRITGTGNWLFLRTHPPLNDLIADAILSASTAVYNSDQILFGIWISYKFLHETITEVLSKKGGYIQYIQYLSDLCSRNSLTSTYVM